MNGKNQFLYLLTGKGVGRFVALVLEVGSFWKEVKFQFLYPMYSLNTQRQP